MPSEYDHGPCLWHGAPRSSRSARRSPWSPSSCSSASRPAASASSPRPCTPASTRAAALLTLWAVGVADRPADPQHPYGHGKAQNLSALGRGRDPRAAGGLDRGLGDRAPARRRRRGAGDLVRGRAARRRARDRRRARHRVGARRAQRGQRCTRSQRGALRVPTSPAPRRHGGARADCARPSARRCDRRPLRGRARRLRRRAARRAPT